MDWYNYYKCLYESCLSNKDFLLTVENNYDRIKAMDISLLQEKKINNDIKIVGDSDDTMELFLNNKLRTVRLGVTESRFLIKQLFDKSIPGDRKPIVSKDDDFEIKKHCGLYYSHESDKLLVREWWIDSAKKLLLDPSTTLSSCFLFLPYDLFLLSSLGIKNKNLINHRSMLKIIELFGKKKVLLLSNGAESMKKSFDMGLQRAYKVNVPNFDIYAIKTPQTTLGMPYPHRNSIETTEWIIEDIKRNYSDFDVALLACGSYGPPLCKRLLETFGDRNMIYLGSVLYTMFGLYAKGVQKPDYNKNFFNVDGFTEVEESCPESCKDMDKGKYWK